ncbi:MAG: putative ribonuclease VapC [Candidatus Amesbacteria bacterium GW2011_GWA2_47_11b]|uniref:Putative ribonuclease VapC n=1 Tax=Candidatus Amesbacteria bacterium GW2011_GWA2_47_11b TaxID=1618358 RepID=A0A0G1RJI2_9BACT|nr:MAG: putative ribonuclease VapC [Candidatus Amesbacteria bacterium GW2011_GWA2_47_11b]
MHTSNLSMFGTMILLDTSAIIGLAGNKKWIVGILEKYPKENLFISVITIAEVKTGRFLSKNKNEAVSRFLNESINQGLVSAINIDQAVAEEFAKLQSRLLNKGLPLSPFDGLIAATALCRKARLATSDADFSRVKELKTITP